jgi:osmotically-inducible protein OsmY
MYLSHMEFIARCQGELQSKSNATIATWVVTVTLITACSVSPPKSPQEAEADEATAERVYAALNADPIYFYRHVDVRVDSGVTHLSGYVWDIDALYTAKRIAAGVPGVTRVVNQMELERAGTRGGGHSGSG